MRAREDVRPMPVATPVRAKPVPKSTPSPARPVATPTPRPMRKATQVPPTPRPTPRATPRPTPRSTPRPTPKPTPRATPKATPKQTAKVHVEKSGRSSTKGLQPASKRTRAPRGRWRYLTSSVRRQIDSARVKKGRWKYIVVHNSGTRQGNAKIFNNYHKRVRKMQNGMAYHFVIGNGTSSGNGEIEVGDRWTRQINGGHVASDYLNNIALGICLVGDFNRDRPSQSQLNSLEELITYLRGRVGTVKGKRAIVRGHKEINPKPTDCPGKRFPLSWLRQKFGR
ncbi:MAG: peptidoglycan recognition family protein [Chthoniobacterales bacterium]